MFPLTIQIPLLPSPHDLGATLTCPLYGETTSKEKPGSRKFKPASLPLSHSPGRDDLSVQLNEHPWSLAQDHPTMLKKDEASRNEIMRQKLGAQITRKWWTTCMRFGKALKGKWLNPELEGREAAASLEAKSHGQESATMVTIWNHLADSMGGRKQKLCYTCFHPNTSVLLTPTGLCVWIPRGFLREPENRVEEEQASVNACWIKKRRNTLNPVPKAKNYLSLNATSLGVKGSLKRGQCDPEMDAFKKWSRHLDAASQCL